MADEVNSVSTLKDNFISAINNMMKQQKNFKRETQELYKQLGMLNGKKIQLKIDEKAAGKNLTKTLREAQKEFDKTGKHSEAMKKRIHDAVSRKITLKFSTDSANKNIKNVEKSIKKLETDIDKVNKKKIDSKGTSPENKKAAPVSGKSASGSGDSIFAPIKGIAGNLLNIFSYVTGAVNSVANAGISTLNIAGQMEQTQTVFEMMLKNNKNGQKMMEDLKDFSIKSPFEFGDLAKTTQAALSKGFKQNDMISLLQDAGDAALGTGKGQEGVDNIINALGQMQKKGKVSAQEMDMLTDNGIDAWDYVAKGIKKSADQAKNLAEKGLLPADKAIRAIRNGMRQDFSGNMNKQSRTLLATLANIKKFVTLNILGSFGEGIQQGILPSLQRFTDKLTKSGAGMDLFKQNIRNVGKSIGEFLGNNADRLVNFFEKLFSDEQFQKADFGEKIKMTLDKIYTSIKTWFDGEGGSKIKEAFKSMSDGAMQIFIVAATKYIPEFADLGLQIGGAILSGIGSALADKIFGEISDKQGKDFEFSATSTNLTDMINRSRYVSKENKKYGIEQTNKYDTFSSALLGGMGDAFSNIKNMFSNIAKPKESAAKSVQRAMPYAFGVSRVPYNNYPALLHEGERVLTKQEANKTAGFSISIAKLADHLVIREEADIEKVTERLALKLYKYSLNTGGV